MLYYGAFVHCWTFFPHGVCLSLWRFTWLNWSFNKSWIKHQSEKLSRGTWHFTQDHSAIVPLVGKEKVIVRTEQMDIKKCVPQSRAFHTGENTQHCYLWTGVQRVRYELRVSVFSCFSSSVFHCFRCFRYFRCFFVQGESFSIPNHTTHWVKCVWNVDPI